MSMKIGCMMYVRIPARVCGVRFLPALGGSGGLAGSPPPDIVFVVILN